MALEALRDVLLQAGQDYFKTNRQNQLLAEERAREDEVYKRRLEDQIKAEERAYARQKETEERAYTRQKETETRQIDNDVARLRKMKPVETDYLIRSTLASWTGDSSYMDESKRSAADVAEQFKAAQEEKAYRDVFNAEKAKVRAGRELFKDSKDLNDQQLQQERDSTVANYDIINAKLADVQRRVGEIDKDRAKEIKDAYDRVVNTVVSETMGGAEPGTPAWARRLKELKLPPTSSPAEVAQMSMLEINQRFKLESQALMMKDPKLQGLLAEQQQLLHDRGALLQHGTKLAVNFGQSRSGVAAVTREATGNEMVPSPDGSEPTNYFNGGSATPSAAAPSAPSAGTPAAPSTGGNATALLNALGAKPKGGSAPTPAAAPASSEAATAAPSMAPAPAAAPSGPSFLSRAIDVAKDNPVAVASTVAAAAPYAGSLGSSIASGVTNAGRQVMGAASRVPGFLSEAAAANSGSYLRTAAEAAKGYGGSRVAGIGASALGRAAPIAGIADLANSYVPSALNFLGATNTKEIYGDKTPTVAQLVGDAYLASTEEAPVRKFNDWYTDKYQTIVRANIAAEAKDAEMAKLKAARDEWFAQGNKWDTPLKAAPVPEQSGISAFFNPNNWQARGTKTYGIPDALVYNPSRRVPPDIP